MDASTYKRIRMALGLTQQDLADRLGITQNYVAMMENGRREVSISQGLRMVTLLQDAVRSGDIVAELFKQILLGEKPDPEKVEAASKSSAAK